MPLIAAASINIDFAIVITITLAVLFFGGLFALMFYGARAAVRRICMNNDITQSEIHKRRGYHGAFNRRHA